MTQISSIHILVVDDEANAREGLKDLLEGWGFRVSAASDGKEALELIKKLPANVIISDLVMPEMTGMDLLQRVNSDGLLPHTTFIMLTAYGNIETAVQAIKEGAYDFLTKPLDVVRLKILLERVVKRKSLDAEMALLKDKVRKLGKFGALNGTTPQMKAVFKQVQVVAPTLAPVFITGEAGTGKDLLAKAIHQNSKRSAEPYISINCHTIPPSMLEGELFGSEVPQPDGSVRIEPGAFGLADRGTLFVDEITDMPAEIQIKLLRALEESKIRRVGGKIDIPVNVRMIAATNKMPEECVEDGSLREDLFYRLSVFSIKIPPLRDRAEDIPLLAHTFMEEFNLKNDRHVKGFTDEVINLIKKYSWPGNVRELKNVIERAVILCKNDYIEIKDLPESLTSKAHKTPTIEFRVGQTMDEVEKQFLFHTLSHADGNKTKAAKTLDISLKTLHNKLSKYKSSI